MFMKPYSQNPDSTAALSQMNPVRYAHRQFI